MAITDMAAARYAQTHTTHLRHTGLGQLHYSNFCYGRFSRIRLASISTQFCLRSLLASCLWDTNSIYNSQ